MESKKPVPLPPSLADLPRFGTTSTSSSSRKDNERTDVAFGVNSMDDLVEKMKRGFASEPTKTPRSTK
jgi:hypothetical protein